MATSATATVPQPGDLGTTQGRRMTLRAVVAAATGKISLATVGASATQVADLLLDTAEGIKTRHRTMLSADAYRRRLGDAVRIVIAAFTASTPARRRPSRRS